MPSNVEYIEQANALAKELGVEIITEGLNNSDLGALVKKLNADKVIADKAAADKVAADKVAADKVAADKVAADKLPPYSMAMGKALTTKAGIKADGDEVTAEMLPGGKNTLAKFVKLGYIVKG